MSRSYSNVCLRNEFVWVLIMFSAGNYSVNEGLFIDSAQQETLESLTFWPLHIVQCFKIDILPVIRPKYGSTW